MKLHLRPSGVTCHSVTCHQTQVNTPRLNPSQRPVLDIFCCSLLRRQKKARDVTQKPNIQRKKQIMTTDFVCGISNLLHVIDPNAGSIWKIYRRHRQHQRIELLRSLVGGIKVRTSSNKHCRRHRVFASDAKPRFTQ